MLLQGGYQNFSNFLPKCYQDVSIQHMKKLAWLSNGKKSYAEKSKICNSKNLIFFVFRHWLKHEKTFLDRMFNTVLKKIYLGIQQKNYFVLTHIVFTELHGKMCYQLVLLFLYQI